MRRGWVVGEVVELEHEGVWDGHQALELVARGQGLADEEDLIEPSKFAQAGQDYGFLMTKRV